LTATATTMKWLAGQGRTSACNAAGGRRAKLGEGDQAGELSHSTIRARWRRSWGPSEGRIRGQAVEPQSPSRDLLLWTTLRPGHPAPLVSSADYVAGLLDAAGTWVGS
jgi:hypothetical protein